MSEHIVTTERRQLDTDLNEMPEQSDSSGNMKWIMGMIATAVVSGLLGWTGSVNKAIPELQVAMAVTQARVEFMSAEMARLTRAIEKLSADHDEDKRRAAR